MPDLDSYFEGDKGARKSYPLIRLLESRQGQAGFGGARVEVIRPRAALGFEPAQLTLHFLDKQGNMSDYKTEPWDAELNNVLVARKIRAIDLENETQRFGLALGAALEPVETRYGDGFFSAVLMLVIDQSPFAGMEPVKQLRLYIHTNKPYQGGHSADDCGAVIQTVLQDRWLELRRTLEYDKAEGERIMAGALAYCLDERFSITDGRKLGWLMKR